MQDFEVRIHMSHAHMDTNFVHHLAFIEQVVCRWSVLCVTERPAKQNNLFDAALFVCFALTVCFPCVGCVCECMCVRR